MRDADLETYRVSIIMPTHNCESFVSESIQSILFQDFKSWELIIVDDDSKDFTKEKIYDFAQKDSRIRTLYNEVNQGPAVTRNKGIKAASGRYIAFLDSDDIWYPKKLSVQLEEMERTDTGLVYSDYDVFRENPNKPIRTIHCPQTVRYKDFLRGCPIGCLTAMYDTAKVGKVYMPDLRQRQDWGLWMRILRECDKGAGIKTPLAALRVHSDSLTADKFKATKYTWQLLRQEADLDPFRAGFGVLSHLSTAALRRLRG